MAMTFQLEILTLAKEYLREEIHSVIAPGSEGRFSVHAGHAAGIFALEPGVLEISPSGGHPRILATGGGFLVVEPGGNKVSVMVRSAETPNEIDERRAREAMKRAQERLRKKGQTSAQDDLDVSRAERALARAIARLKVKPIGGRFH